MISTREYKSNNSEKRLIGLDTFLLILVNIQILIKWISIDKNRRKDHENVIIFNFEITGDFILILKKN